MLNGKVETAVEQRRYRVVKVATKLVLDAHWPYIRRGLCEIKDKIGQAKPRWEPEHIRFAILRGHAGQSSTELFLILAELDEVIGFFITTTDLDPFFNIPLDFHVWFTWSHQPHIVEAIEPEIQKLARERGCTGVEGISPRSAWRKRLQPLGYYIKHIVWRKDLEV